MIKQITTEHFFRALQCCPACLVDGRPSAISLPERLPSRNSKNPFAVLYWAIQKPKQKRPSVMSAELYTKEIRRIERTDDFAVRIIFFDYDPIEITLLRMVCVETVSPAIRHIGVWKQVPVVGTDQWLVEGYQVSDHNSLN